MTTPKQPSTARRARKQQSLVASILLIVFGLFLLSVFGSTAVLEDHMNLATRKNTTRPVMPHAEPVQRRMIIEVDEIDHEERFGAIASKSCLPATNKKCQEFIPKDPEDHKIQRIAFLSPPGDLAASLLHRVEQIATVHNQNMANSDSHVDMKIIHTSHIPPYGYGKKHGYTKMIRLVPDPLMLQVTDALTALLRPGETHRIITLQDVKDAFLQITRWHCRISHVSAHTALLSIPLVDLLSDPAGVTEKLEHFLIPRDVPVEKLPGGGDDDVVMEMPDDDQGGLMDAEMAYGNQILTHVQELAKTDVLAVLNTLFLDEMKETKEYSKWPCPSFWSGELSDITKRLAKSLSPDCDDPFNTCFVERDKCEYRGDAECKKKKRV